MLSSDRQQLQGFGIIHPDAKNIRTNRKHPSFIVEHIVTLGKTTHEYELGTIRYGRAESSFFQLNFRKTVYLAKITRYVKRMAKIDLKNKMTVEMFSETSRIEFLNLFCLNKARK